MHTNPADTHERSTLAAWDSDLRLEGFEALVRQGEILGDTLDTGCGTGALVEFLYRKSRRAIGIDLNPAMIESAKERFRTVLFPPWFGVCSPLELPGLGLKFDCIVDSGTFDGLRDDDSRAAYLVGVAKVLRIGGRCYLLTVRRPDDVRSLFTQAYMVQMGIDVRFRPPEPLTPTWMAVFQTVERGGGRHA